MTRNEQTAAWVRQVWPVGLTPMPDFLMQIVVNMIHAREEACIAAMRASASHAFDEAEAALRGEA
ncbi:MAG TPA: hypothetical protein VLI71_00225 [Gammaproteobacteria bacterium]|nr:hypothetical protein [Gammaproteobacteria bacterium]